MRTKISDLNIEQEKLEIIKWVTTLKDETSIERLKMLRENPNKTDWWNEISDEEKNAIDKVQFVHWLKWKLQTVKDERVQSIPSRLVRQC